MELTDEEIRRLSRRIAIITVSTWREAYLTTLGKLQASQGACEKAFRAALRNINLEEFSEALKRRLRW